VRPQISHFTLSNGLEVVVIPDHRAPVVTHMLWYKVGSADETPGKSGLAHFLEHLMFKGTEKNPSGRFSQVVATIGGQENAFTSADYTGYFQRVPRDKLKAMMEFEADRMTGLSLPTTWCGPSSTSCWKSRTCGSPTIPRRGSANRWTQRST
jgi:zinc protease